MRLAVIPRKNPDTKQSVLRSTTLCPAVPTPQAAQGTRHGVNWEPVCVIVRIQLFGGWFPPMMLKACETRREGADYGVDM